MHMPGVVELVVSIKVGGGSGSVRQKSESEG